MIITRKHLPRRTFLRGLGATLALPLLDSMIPALTAQEATAAQPVGRLGIVYVPNGIYMPNWTPSEDGRGFALPSSMQPLAPFRDQMAVVTGLSNKMGDAWPGEGAGDHARAAGAYLTAVHPKKTEGADLRAGLSMDQIAAQVLGKRHAGIVEVPKDRHELTLPKAAERNGMGAWCSADSFWYRSRRWFFRRTQRDCHFANLYPYRPG